MLSVSRSSDAAESARIIIMPGPHPGAPRPPQDDQGARGLNHGRRGPFRHCCVTDLRGPMPYSAAWIAAMMSLESSPTLERRAGTDFEVEMRVGRPDREWSLMSAECVSRREPDLAGLQAPSRSKIPDGIWPVPWFMMISLNPVGEDFGVRSIGWTERCGAPTSAMLEQTRTAGLVPRRVRQISAILVGGLQRLIRPAEIDTLDECRQATPDPSS